MSRPAKTRRGCRGRTRRQNPSGDFTGNYAASPWTGADGLLLFNANVGARRTPRRPPPAPIARLPDRHPICAKLSMIEWHERSKTPAFSVPAPLPPYPYGILLLFSSLLSLFPPSLALFRPKKPTARRISSFISLATRNIRVQIVPFPISGEFVCDIWSLQSKVDCGVPWFQKIFGAVGLIYPLKLYLSNDMLKIYIFLSFKIIKF